MSDYIIWVAEQIEKEEHISIEEAMAKAMFCDLPEKYSIESYLKE